MESDLSPVSTQPPCLPLVAFATGGRFALTSMSHVVLFDLAQRAHMHGERVLLGSDFNTLLSSSLQGVLVKSI